MSLDGSVLLSRGSARQAEVVTRPMLRQAPLRKGSAALSTSDHSRRKNNPRRQVRWLPLSDIISLTWRRPTKDGTTSWPTTSRSTSCKRSFHYKCTAAHDSRERQEFRLHRCAGARS